MCVSSQMRAPAQHTLSSMVNILEHVFQWHYMCCVQLYCCQWFSTVWHPSHWNMEPHCLLWYLSMFPVGLPSVNWLYCDITHLPVASCGYMTTQMTYPQSMVRRCYFMGKILLPYFWNLILQYFSVSIINKIDILKFKTDILHHN